MELNARGRVAASGSATWSYIRRLPPAWRAATVVVSAALVAACFVRFGFSGRAAVGSFFAAVLVLLTAIDLRTRLIPDVILLPALVICLAAQIALYPGRTLEWVLAALATALFFFIPSLIGGMGMGDVKLAALLGAVLGRSVAGALLVGLLAGGLFGLVLVARGGRAALRRGVAYGPFLAFGAVVVLLLGGR